MDAHDMWERWYALPLARRTALIAQYEGEFNAAWALFGDVFT